MGLLTIEKINISGPTHPPVPHKVLPQHEFCMLMVAPTGSGKTNLICNLITKQYKGYFNKIWVCSPTVNNDDKWEYVRKERGILKENKKLAKILDGAVGRKPVKKIVFKNEIAKEYGKDIDNKFDGKISDKDFFTNMEDLMPRLAGQQEIIDTLKKKDKSKYIADRILVILDDQAGMFKGGNFNNPIVNYVIKHRHYSSSCIVVTQAYKAIPKTIRVNQNALILFAISNNEELKCIYEENTENMDMKTWLKVFDVCTEKPHSFMYINNKFPKGERVFCNFTSQMSIRYDDTDDDESIKGKKRKYMEEIKE